MNVISENALYATLGAEELDMSLELKRVRHESRIHLDIETDVIEAEVGSLEEARGFGLK